jgi:prepilin-type processing-associated H-X9-DG protein
MSVIMADAIPEQPRHNGANDFLFVDAHVETIRLVHYLDPEGPDDYAKARDKDPLGNRPYWSWGLGTGIVGN